MADEPQNLREAIDNIGRRFEEFKQHHQKELDEIKQHGVASAETREQLERASKALDTAEDIKVRLEQLEVERDTPSNPNGGESLTKEQRQHREAFLAYLRNPNDRESELNLREAEKAVKRANPQAAIDTTGNTTGGYAVPETISQEIAEKVNETSPMRQYARVVTAGTPDYKELVDVRGEAYGWVGETDSRSETGTAALQEVAPTFGTIYAYPKATEESLNDVFFDVEEFIRRTTIRGFRKGEGIAFITGNGTNKPTGFLNGTPEATGDDDSPARTFGELEYVPTGDASGFGSLATASPEHYPADVLFDAVHKMNPAYLGNSVWMANKGTWGTIRKFKDVDGFYIYQPSLTMGQPATCLGYPAVTMPDMPDVGANNFPLAFGDFMEGYLIVDLVGLRVTRDEVTTPGYVKWYIRRRVGGKILNDDALKVVKCATS